jgi:NADH dehydrogenase (ubiquinone) 1 alpha subcomplex subunit 8
MQLNKCVFDKLVRFIPAPHSILAFPLAIPDDVSQGLKKVIPGTPKGQVPVNERPSQIFANWQGPQYSTRSEVSVEK